MNSNRVRARRFFEDLPGNLAVGAIALVFALGAAQLFLALAS